MANRHTDSNRLTYKAKYPENGRIDVFHSLKKYRDNEARAYLERNPFACLEIYRGNKLYGVFYLISGKMVMVRQ